MIGVYYDVCHCISNVSYIDGDRAILCGERETVISLSVIEAKIESFREHIAVAKGLIILQPTASLAMHSA